MHLLIDVRQRVQYEICHLPGSVSIPLDQLANRFDETQKIIPDNKQGKAHVVQVFFFFCFFSQFRF
jgi:rhodanese-related sulfurtransferase